MCSQFNVSVSSMKSFFSFDKNNGNISCIFGDCRWYANILLWDIGRVYLEIAPMMESLKNLHYAMVSVWEYQNIFVKCWPYCQETQQIGFGNLIDFEITCKRYFTDKIQWRLNVGFGYCESTTNQRQFTLKQGRSHMCIECGLLWFLI